MRAARSLLAAALLLGCGRSTDQAPAPTGFAALREAMVRDTIVTRDVQDERVLAAMRKVPRHEFVPEAQRRYAYEDRPLPIGHDQTI